jgi:AraC-like DNA-binding protein
MIDNVNISLLSGGFFRCDPAWSRSRNLLDQCYKVYFPVSGAAQVEMESGAYEIHPKRIYFISGFRLSRQICERRMDVYWLHFVPESLYLRHLLDQLPPVQSWSRSAGGWPTSAYEDICRIFDHPFSEQNRSRGDLSAAVFCRINGLLLELVAHCLETLDENAFREFHPDFYRLKPTLDFMHQHCRENLPLSCIAAVAGLAPNYFHRRFKRLFGITPFDYIVGQRLNQARHLLASTRLTIKEVADAVGYRDPLYLTRVFARRLQVTPTEYRAAHQLDNRHLDNRHSRSSAGCGFSAPEKGESQAEGIAEVDGATCR